MPELFIRDDLAREAAQLNLKEKYETPGASANEPYISHLKTLIVRNLADWTTEEDLKNLFTHNSAVGLQTLFTVAFQKQQIINNIYIARDPETQKCTGYAFVEFTEHAIASEIFDTMPGPNFRLPNTNKPLILEWAKNPIKPSSVLDNYHLYLGNMRPGLTESTIYHVLKKFHEALASVMLIPEEVLGVAPPYMETRTDETSAAVSTAAAFYCGSPHIPTNVSKVRVVKGDMRWSAAFIRLSDKYVLQWKLVLQAFRAGLLTEEAKVLRRDIFTSAALNYDDAEFPHDSVALVMRPIFGMLDDAAPTGFRYTGGGLPSIDVPDFKKGKKNRAVGSFPEPHPLMAGTPYAETPAVEEMPYGPQSKLSLYISQLSDDTTDDDVKLLLSPFGPVLAAKVAFLRHAAYVDMGDHRSVLAALSHLRDCSLKKNKIQFDWGRPRLSQTPALELSEVESATERERKAVETNFVRKWNEAMVPPKRRIVVAEKAPEVNLSEKEKNFWLSTLCASLPTQPT